MSRPLRENLELNTDAGSPRVLCLRCGFDFGEGEHAWLEKGLRKRLPPTTAGPLMNDLEGAFLLEQVYCPSCKTLLNSEIVEAAS